MSVGGLAVSLPRDVRASHVLLRRPGRGAALYILATTELPALAALAIATRSYLQGADSAAATYGTTFFLILTYLLGYGMWSFLRAFSSVWALFSASFVAFWGICAGFFLASLGPISLVAPVAGLGGVAASLPYLWDRSQDDGASVLDASG